MTLTQEQAEQIGSEWLDAWNRHDLDAILSHYADNVEFTSPFVARLTNDASGTLYGKEALRTYFAKALSAYPDLHFELFHVLTGKGSLVIYYRSVNNLLAAEAMTLNEDGQIMHVQCHYCLAP